MVYYVAFYNPKEEEGRRIANYAGEDKIDYICEAIIKAGEQVTILSNTKSIKKKFLKRTEYIKSKDKKIIMFASLANLNIFVHIIDVLFGFIQLFIYILNNVKKDDTVLVYHSLGYRNIFKYLKKIKKFKYILEVEELYKNIEIANSFKRKEEKVFKYPDAFIFSNNILERKINVDDKLSVVINGIYKNEVKVGNKMNNGKTNIVYAGSLEKQKGVDYIIKATQYLNENYEMHVIGFGLKQDVIRVKELISKISIKTKCLISYDGIFKGDDYNKYIQQFDIGVCIQDPTDIFNKYEFPSKVFSYMANGLCVVINRLEQIEKSEIANYVNIVEGTEPEKIASTILKIKKDKIISTEILKKLDDDFIINLKILLKENDKDVNE